MSVCMYIYIYIYICNTYVCISIYIYIYIYGTRIQRIHRLAGDRRSVNLGGPERVMTQCSSVYHYYVYYH